MTAPEPFPEALRVFHDTQVSLEKFRIQAGNRVWALEHGTDVADAEVLGIYRGIHASALEWEQAMDALMARAVETRPVWNHWLRHVRGIGPALGSQLMAMLKPVLVERGPSTWYKAAGLVPELIGDQWRLPRPRKQEEAEQIEDDPASDPVEERMKLGYYPRLRRCLFNVATSFMRSGGYYREVYDRQKRRLTEVHAGDKAWPPIRLDRAARWAMVKLFLAHLWEKSLEAEGLGSGRRAYVLEVLKHPNYIPPPEPPARGKI